MAIIIVIEALIMAVLMDQRWHSPSQTHVMASRQSSAVPVEINVNNIALESNKTYITLQHLKAQSQPLSSHRDTNVITQSQTKG